MKTGGSTQAIDVGYGSGEDAQPFRAKLQIPCLIGGCMVRTEDGTERRSRMNLVLYRHDGVVLQRPYNDGPYYVCERPGCFYHEHPRGLHEINSQWIRDEAKGKQKIRTEEDIENMKEVLA